jgi:small-conductance mechanosensitive channel/CRP-like cAMP-binding protein
VHPQALLNAPPAVYGLAIGALGLLVLTVLMPRGGRRAVRGPFVLLVVYGAARFAVELFPPTDVVPKILHFIGAFAWGAGLVRSVFILFASSRVTRFLPKWPIILRDVVQGVLYVGVGLASLRAIGVEPSSLLTTSALLTAVVGLSLQETLGNLFAGLAIQNQETIVVGDWVRFADGHDGVGEVIEINWRATHFLTPGHAQVVVPNGVLARSTIRNYSRPTPVVRIETEIVLPYDVSPEHARTILLAALQGVEGIAREPAPSVVVGDFNDSGVAYSVRFFITDFSRHDPIESAARQRILYALRRAKIEIPFPQRHFDLVGTAATKLAGLPEPKAVAASDLAARLARTEVFRGLDRALLASLGETTQPLLYAPGEIIIRQNDPGTDLYALERGQVELVVGNEEGLPVRVSVLDAGAVFGEAAFLTGGRRMATIVALSECEVLAIPRSSLHHLLEKNRALSERLAKVLADRMDLLSQALNQAAENRLDDDRRSDLLFERIRQFFGQ